MGTSVAQFIPEPAKSQPRPECAQARSTFEEAHTCMHWSCNCVAGPLPPMATHTGKSIRAALAVCSSSSLSRAARKRSGTLSGITKEPLLLPSCHSLPSLPYLLVLHPVFPAHPLFHGTLQALVRHRILQQGVGTHHAILGVSQPHGQERNNTSPSLLLIKSASEVPGIFTERSNGLAGKAVSSALG